VSYLNVGPISNHSPLRSLPTSWNSQHNCWTPSCRLSFYVLLTFYLVIKSHTKLNKDLLIWKSLLPYSHLVLFLLGYFYWPSV